MINRILIRQKVVQMLYAYLLTRSDFKIEQAPERHTRDSACAYKSYLELLMLILELSGQSVSPDGRRPNLLAEGKNALASAKIVSSLTTDSDLREVIVRRGATMERLDGILPGLYKAIADSHIYGEYSRKRTRTLADDVILWKVLLPTVIAKYKPLTDALRSEEGFTMAGWEKGVEMAIKTLDGYSDQRTSLAEARRQLTVALDKSYELYHALLLLMVEITNMQAQRIEANKNKYLPTPEDLNPNMRMVNNRLVYAIANHPDMEAFLKDHPISWEADLFLVKDLLDTIVTSQIYRDYMNSADSSWESDCAFWREVYKNIILPSDALADALESKNVYWNDDLHIMGTFVLKTIKQLEKSNQEELAHLLPQYKDEEDAEFGPKLFIDTINNRETYRGYIDRFIKQDWDPERIAFMDVVVLLTAISELVNFPAIPLPVTINEYIDIAADYSTPKSGQFVNGILYSVARCLNEEGIINKQ